MNDLMVKKARVSPYRVSENGTNKFFSAKKLTGPVYKDNHIALESK